MAASAVQAVSVSTVARRGQHAALYVIAFSIVLRLAFTLVLPHPRPYVADEFSYLLGGETFAAGRLASAQHPLWRFFESPHILVHPVYASKYPPAQAVSLAFGDAVFGDPAAGVLLSMALFAGAVCWALEAFVPVRWAVVGGLFTAVCFGPGHYWTESYWGGAVAALGAALCVGTAGRSCAIGIVRADGRVQAGRVSHISLMFALGAFVLLNSRPFEGGVLVLCSGAVVMWRCRGNLAVLAAAAMVIALVMGLYNWRVTGH